MTFIRCALIGAMLATAPGCVGQLLLPDPPDFAAPPDPPDATFVPPPPDLTRIDLADPRAMPIITEFLAGNRSGLRDEDGDASNWIEIYNPDPRPLDLEGYHLTDSKTNPIRWTFPPGTILPSGAYLVVLASGKDRIDPGKPLHTNFSLSMGERCPDRGTEYLALTDPGGKVLPPSWDPFPVQSTDVSYGLLKPQADAMGAFFVRPTPGAPNNEMDAFAEAVTYDPPGGTFTAGKPLSVALKATSKTATIRYTTNRSRPIAAAGRTGTFTVDPMTDVCTWVNHGLAFGDLVRVSGPAPLIATVNYFVTVLDADRFQLTVEPGGPPIDLGAAGSQTLRRDATTGAAAITDFITTIAPYTFFGGDPVEVSSTGVLPGGLAANTTYYVVPGAVNTFRLATTAALSPVVDITTTGSGTLTIFRIPSPIYTNPISIPDSTWIRARAFEPQRPDGPITSSMYFAVDAAASMFSSNLPLIVSHTWNTAMANNIPVDGYLMIFEPKAPNGLARLTNPPDLASPCALERRGSSTAGDPKFSMRIELQDEDGIDRDCRPFGMPAHADWILHAPYKFDKAMMRNDLMYGLSNDSGRYAVRTQLVEHIHNEQSLPATIEGAVAGTDYFGVYSFMEKITRGKNRVDVENLTLADNAPPAIQGGYMFKSDRLDGAEMGLRPLMGQNFDGAGTGGAGTDILAWVNPREVSFDPFKVVTTAQSNWLRAHIGAACVALVGPDSTDPVKGYAAYWDTAAMIDHNIFNNASKNPDAFRLSSYWHKPRLGKLTPGPIWDFDRTQGSTDGRDFDWGTWQGGMDFFTYPWYKEMFADANFRQAWIDRFHALRQGPFDTASIHARIDVLVNQLNPGDGADTPAKRSIIRWNATAPRTSMSNTGITNMLFNGQYTGEVAWLKYWWERHLAFMDSQIVRPAIADPPPSKFKQGDKVTLTSPSQAMQGVKIYYTTDGTDPRLSTPGAMPSPKAVEYKGPISITPPVQIFVRTFNPVPMPPPINSSWSAPAVLDYR